MRILYCPRGSAIVSVSGLWISPIGNLTVRFQIHCVWDSISWGSSLGANYQLTSFPLTIDHCYTCLSIAQSHTTLLFNMPIQAPTPLSSPQGRRRRLRRLFTKLKHNQADDVPIPNPTIFEIKFYLKTSRRCHRVFVADEGDPSQNVPIIISELIPNFISSQLDAQRIADQDRQSVQLSTVLVFLSRHFAINPIRYASSPTLFCWRDTDHRRTFCVFAYLNCRMDSRTYSATELLSLRGSNGSDTSPDLLTKLKSDPEIGRCLE